MNLNLIILINILLVIGFFCLLSAESSAVPMLSLQSNYLNNHWNLFKSKNNRTHHNRTHESNK
jgi:hypothetical protein